jgi:hypothetical protein
MMKLGARQVGKIQAGDHSDTDTTKASLRFMVNQGKLVFRSNLKKRTPFPQIH